MGEDIQQKVGIECGPAGLSHVAYGHLLIRLS